MTAWHVAPEELRDRILEEGLDPHGDRAVLLLAEPPDDVDGFDLWEVDAETEEGCASFCQEPIGPERMRLHMPSAMPGI